jgi:predicted Zn-dependent peptidase
VIGAVETATATALPSEDFESAVRQFQVETLLSLQTPAGMGGAIGRSAMLTGSPSVTAALENARRLTPETLRQAAVRNLTAAHRSVVWMLPGGPPGGGASDGTSGGASGARKGGR